MGQASNTCCATPVAKLLKCDNSVFNPLVDRVATCADIGGTPVAATNGLNIAPAGTVRLGGTLDATTTIDGDFTLIRNSGAVTAIQTNTTGVNANGINNVTAGNFAHGSRNTTAGIDAAGSYNITSGIFANGSYNVTTGGSAYGASNSTSGNDSYGTYNNTSGANSHGSFNNTIGANAHGSHNNTTGVNAHGVYSQVLGAGAYAGYFNGDILYTGALVPSDRRLKENITPITTAIDGILKLEVVEFDKFSESDIDLPQPLKTSDEKQAASEQERIAKTLKQIEAAIGREFTEEELKAGKARIRKAQGHRTGVIAQQLQEVFPQFVNTSGEFLAIDESGINYMLLKAVQELAERVKVLESK